MKFSLKWINTYTTLPLQDTAAINAIVDKIALQIVDVDERWVGKDDTIIDIDNKIITNRAYCFGHRGMAREIAVMLNQNYTGNRYPVLPHSSNELPVTVRVDAPDLCPRFTAIAVKGVAIGPSPEELKAAVESVGLRSINNLVDITNLIMLDTGQPVHAYDYHKIKNAEIIVRKAKNGEKVTTLDGEERELNESMLLITDSEKIIGIGGVMGAGNSEIDDNTVDVILEAANFHPKNIRQTARTLRHRTDAVTRFEKGPDPSNLQNVQSYMVELVMKYCGGTVASDLVDTNNLESYSAVKHSISTLAFKPARVEKLLGFTVNNEFIKKVFSGFDIKILQENGDEWLLEIPSWRPDIKESADLVEDICRMYGPQNIPAAIPFNRLVAPAYNKKIEVLKKIRKALTSSGLDEILTYSFVSKSDLEICGSSEHDAIEIINPLTVDYSYLRPSLIASHVKAVSENAKYFESFGLFEISRKFVKKTVEKKEYADDKGESLRPDEVEVIGAVLYSKNAKEQEIFDLKGAIENLFDALKIGSVIFTPDGSIQCEGTLVGNIGLLSKTQLSRFDIDAPVAFVEILLQPLVDKFQDTKQYIPFSKFQGTILDYSVLVPIDVPVQQILTAVPDHAVIIEKSVFDVYKDASLGDKKSISIRLKLQKPDANLTEADIYDAGISVENSLKSVQGLEIRGGGVKKSQSMEVQTEKTEENSKPTIVVGKILEIEKHPNADRLVVCKIDVGAAKPEGTLFSDVLQIVTGAPNITQDRPVGAIIPVALPGAVVKSHKDGSTITIAISKLRGEVSEGMLCSKDELGLEDNIGGIWILDESYNIGEEFIG